MVGIHFAKLVYFGTNIVMTFGTLRTIGNALCLRFAGLAGIHSFLYAILKDTDI